MTRAAAKFSFDDVRRAVRAVKSGDIPIQAVHFPPEGGFSVLIGEPAAAPVLGRSGENEWDDVLRQ